MGGSVNEKTPTIAHHLQYYALRGAVGALRRLSFKRAGDVGEWLGLLGYRPIGIRRGVVERQLRAVFPGLADAEVQRIARESYANLGRTSIEAAVAAGRSAQELLDLFERVDGWEVVEREYARGRKVLIVSGHIGNWEIGGAYFSARGFVMEAVARGMENPLFDRYLTETRRQMGVDIIHDADAVRRVPRAIREGHVVGFLFDQGAVGLASTWVPFLGRYAKTPRGPAVFALRLNAPIIFAASLRLPSGRFHITFEEIVTDRTGDREAAVDRLVQGYSEALERVVRRHPEQYFWQHRRWKHQRPGTPPELGDPS